MSTMFYGAEVRTITKEKVAAHHYFSERWTMIDCRNKPCTCQVNITERRLMS